MLKIGGEKEGRFAPGTCREPEVVADCVKQGSILAISISKLFATARYARSPVAGGEGAAANGPHKLQKMRASAAKERGASEKEK